MGKEFKMGIRRGRVQIPAGVRFALQGNICSVWAFVCSRQSIRMNELELPAEVLFGGHFSGLAGKSNSGIEPEAMALTFGGVLC
jgi:hypothetical protein